MSRQFIVNPFYYPAKVSFFLARSSTAVPLNPDDYPKSGYHAVDLWRPLTEAGRARALEIPLPAHIDIAITTTALRGIETARYACFRKGVGAIHVLSELYGPPINSPDWEAMQKLFKLLGSAPLTQYFALWQREVETLFNRYAHATVEAMTRIIASNYRQSSNVLIVGHEILLSIIASHLNALRLNANHRPCANIKYHQGEEMIQGSILDHCEGFIITKERVSLLK